MNDAASLPTRQVTRTMESMRRNLISGAVAVVLFVASIVGVSVNALKAQAADLPPVHPAVSGSLVPSSCVLPGVR